MLDRRWRAEVERGLRPVARGLRRAGLTADQLTVTGLVASAVTAVLVAQGRFGWAAVALLASAVPDVLDGAVAKSSGTASPRGAFFDSVADRVADALVLGGAAWWLAGTEPRAAVLALAAAVLSGLISYERARAESLGFDARGGLMERAERVALLFVGLAFDLLVPVLWVLVVLSAVTVVQRFVGVWRQAAGVAHPPRRPLRLSERPRVQRLTQWWPARRARTRIPTSRTRWRNGRALVRRRSRP